MKINYFRYYFVDSAMKKTFFSIQTLIESYIKNSPATFRDQFKTSISNDHLYIFETTANNLYFFMRTRDEEIIQKINSSQLTIEDVRSTLASDEKLGFSSYVYIGDDYIGFGSTHFAPKANNFAEFINQLLKKIDPNLTFELEAIMTHLTKAQAKKLAFVSKAHIKVPVSKKLGADILGSIGVKRANPTLNVDYLEVILKAEQNENIIDQAIEVLDAASSQTERFILSAKENMTDSLRDYYIEAAGGLSDNIYQGKKASETERKIVDKITTNQELKDILTRKRKNEIKQRKNIDSIADYITDNNWN